MKKKLLSLALALVLALTLLPVTATAVGDTLAIGNQGYPVLQYSNGSYFLNLGSIVTGSVDSYQWMTADTKDGEYTAVGSGASGMNCASLADKWVKCVVTDTNSATVETTPVFVFSTEVGDATAYCVSNGTVGYTRNANGFKVYGNFGGSWVSTDSSEDGDWMFFTANSADPGETTTATSSYLAGFMGYFLAEDPYTVQLEATLKSDSSNYSFAFGGDIGFGNDSVTTVTKNGNTVTGVQLVEAESLEEATQNSRSIVIKTPTAPDYCLLSNAAGIKGFADGTGTSYEGSDPGVSLSWINRSRGDTIPFSFSVGTVEQTGASLDAPAATHTVTLDLSNYTGRFYDLAAYDDAHREIGRISDDGATIEVPEDGYVQVMSFEEFSVTAEGATVGTVEYGEIYGCDITNFTKDTTIVIGPVAAPPAATYTVTLDLSNYTGRFYALVVYDNASREIGRCGGHGVTIEVPEDGYVQVMSFNEFSATAEGATVGTMQNGEVYGCDITNFTKDTTIVIGPVAAPPAADIIGNHGYPWLSHDGSTADHYLNLDINGDATSYEWWTAATKDGEYTKVGDLDGVAAPNCRYFNEKWVKCIVNGSAETKPVYIFHKTLGNYSYYFLTNGTIGYTRRGSSFDVYAKFGDTWKSTSNGGNSNNAWLLYAIRGARPSESSTSSISQLESFKGYFLDEDPYKIMMEATMKEEGHFSFGTDLGFGGNAMTSFIKNDNDEVIGIQLIQAAHKALANENSPSIVITVPTPEQYWLGNGMSAIKPFTQGTSEEAFGLDAAGMTFSWKDCGGETFTFSASVGTVEQTGADLGDPIPTYTLTFDRTNVAEGWPELYTYDKDDNQLSYIWENNATGVITTDGYAQIWAAGEFYAAAAGATVGELIPPSSSGGWYYREITNFTKNTTVFISDEPIATPDTIASLSDLVNVNGKTVTFNLDPNKEYLVSIQDNLPYEANESLASVVNQINTIAPTQCVIQGSLSDEIIQTYLDNLSESDPDMRITNGSGFSVVSSHDPVTMNGGALITVVEVKSADAHEYDAEYDHHDGTYYITYGAYAAFIPADAPSSGTIVDTIDLTVDWNKVPALQVGDPAPHYLNGSNTEADHYLTVSCAGLEDYVYGWVREDSESSLGWVGIDSSDTVTNDEKYALAVELRLNEGYTFADNVTLRVNDGAVATIVYIQERGVGIIFELGTLEDIEDAKGETPAETYTVTLDRTNYAGSYLELYAFNKDGSNAGSPISDNNATVSMPTDGFVRVFADEKFTVAAEGATVGTMISSGEGYYYEITGFTKDTTVVMNPRAEHSHEMTKTDAKAPTATQDGNIEYYTCSGCGKTFADAQGKTELKAEDLVIKATGHKLSKIDAKAPTCTEDGNIAYYTCSDCGKTFADAQGKTELKAEDLVISAAGHGSTVEIPAVAATCTEAGKTAGAKCADCGEVIKAQETVPAKGHKVEKIASKAPTYTANGNKEYHYCYACRTAFADADGKTVLTASQVSALVIPQLISIATDKAEISEGAVNKALSESKTETEVTLDLTHKNVVGEKNVDAVAQAELPVAALKVLINENKALTLVKEDATVTLDVKAMQAIAEQAKGISVTLVVKDVETTTLKPAQQAAMESKKVAATISAELICDQTGERIATKDGKGFGGGSVTVSVPVPEKLPAGVKASDLKVYYVADNGSVEHLRSKLEGDKIVFTLNHFSEYVLAADAGDLTTPNTGDDRPIAACIMLNIFSAAAIVMLIATKKKVNEF